MNKHNFRRATAALLAALMLVMAMPFAVLCASAEDGDNTADVIFQQDAVTVASVNTQAAATLTAPPVTATRAGIVVGWSGTLNGQPAIVPADGEISFAAGDQGVFNRPIYLSMTAEEGVTLRLTEGSTGMRFQTEVSLSDWGVLSQLATSLQRGTLIVPQSYVDDMDGELTHASLTALDRQYLDVVTAGWYIERDTTATFAGSIANIKAANHARYFTAAGYVKVTYTNGDVRYHYAQDFEQTTDQVYSHAYRALHDRSSTPTDFYANEVATGSWSPYNGYQINALKSYMQSVVALTSSTAFGGAALAQSSIYTQTGLTLTAISAGEDGLDQENDSPLNASAEWEKYSALLGELAKDASGVLVIGTGASLDLSQFCGVAIEGVLNAFVYCEQDNVILLPFFSYSDFH